jgi:DNA repair photolyase
MKEAGIPTIVWMSPILPFINDTEENLRGLLDYCIKAKVHGILCFGFGVTMRDGSREYYYHNLDKQFPGTKQKYIQHFGNAYLCNSPNNERLMTIFQEICQQHNILCKPDDIFAYLRTFEPKERQMSLF